MPEIKRRLLSLAVAALSLAFSSPASGRTITITTWNIENLGGEGRGFASGYGEGQIPMRTPEQIEALAKLIKEDLKTDVIAIQELSVNRRDGGRSISDPLEQIVSLLGNSWKYFIQPVNDIPEGHRNMFCGFLWNESRVKFLKVFPANLPDMRLCGSMLYSRAPVIAYCEVNVPGLASTDFVLVNLHLKSISDFDENHIIAMTLLEYELTNLLAAEGIREEDRIILGDFNDSPWERWGDGTPKYSPGLYEHMRFKGYRDLVSKETGQTHMDWRHEAIIDHILVNEAAGKHVLDRKARKYSPDSPSKYAEWRQTYSDHFPLSFDLEGELFDDDQD